MIIGIDASRAFLKNRTGVEEYSYQVIRHLMDKLNKHKVVLYIKKNQKSKIKNQNDPEKLLHSNGAGNLKFKNDTLLEIPNNWEIKEINFPYLWTQLGLSLEMLFHPIDILFVPAHTVPLIHPARTIVTIHGLEYEIFPQGYSFWERLYMRLSIKMSCQWAKKIIAVSKNTKKDLMNLYKVPEEKIKIIYEGYEKNLSFRADPPVGGAVEESNLKISSRSLHFGRDDKYLLFIGRLEERKNIVGIIKAFEILKEHYKIPHKLILAGRFGYGKEKIQEELRNTNCVQDIILLGYVSEEKKWELLKSTDVFLFPTFYEGFGIPILEAQSVGVPVVAGDNSSIPEIAGNSTLLVDPNNAEEIADAAYHLLSDKSLRDDIIKKGLENVQRFSWEKCASAIADIIQIRK